MWRLWDQWCRYEHTLTQKVWESHEKWGKRKDRRKSDGKYHLRSWKCCMNWLHSTTDKKNKEVAVLLWYFELTIRYYCPLNVTQYHTVKNMKIMMDESCQRWGGSKCQICIKSGQVISPLLVRGKWWNFILTNSKNPKFCSFNNMPRPCKLTFDLLTLKVVSESSVTWATSVQF